MSHEGNLPEIRGRKITEDEHGNVCLNDLYELAGRPDNLGPTQWKRHKKTIALKAALDDRIVCDTHRKPKEAAESTYYVIGGGRKARTFAHPVLALEYAEALHPDLGIEIKEIFLRYRSNDIGLAHDIYERIAEQIREDGLRVQMREEITLRNKELAAEGAKAGCRGWQYAELHNAGYRGLYNGLDEDGIHRLKALGSKQKILDYMCAAEGAANAFRITQAALRMERTKPSRPEEAFQIAKEAGERTRQAMKEIGGVMPEEMPVPDSISMAKKRLKINREALGKG